MKIFFYSLQSFINEAPGAQETIQETFFQDYLMIRKHSFEIEQ